jgi:hypothetical protein
LRIMLQQMRRQIYVIVSIASSLLACYLLFLLVLNAYGPSTNYFNQSVASAIRGPDGRDYIRVGDNFLVKSEVIRHRLNGLCVLDVWRVRENVDGAHAGDIHLLQFIKQSFVGDDEFRHTSWPIPPAKIVVGEDWFDGPDVQEQTLDVFVVGRYNCNVLDRWIPRWLRSSDGLVDTPNRGRHLVGFSIPNWHEWLHFESEHTRVVLTRGDVK